MGAEDSKRASSDTATEPSGASRRMRVCTTWSTFASVWLAIGASGGGLDLHTQMAAGVKESGAGLFGPIAAVVGVMVDGPASGFGAEEHMNRAGRPHPLGVQRVWCRGQGAGV